MILSITASVETVSPHCNPHKNAGPVSSSILLDNDNIHIYPENHFKNSLQLIPINQTKLWHISNIKNKQSFGKADFTCNIYIVSQGELTEPLNPQDLTISTLTWLVCDTTHRKEVHRDTRIPFLLRHGCPISGLHWVQWDIMGNPETLIGSLTLSCLQWGEKDVSMHGWGPSKGMTLKQHIALLQGFAPHLNMFLSVFLFWP